MRKKLCAILTALMLLSCTAFAAETPAQETPDITVTLTQFDLAERRIDNENMHIAGARKVLWAVRIENNSDIALENYELMLPSMGALTLHVIDPFETTESGKTLTIDILAPGQTKIIPVILTAPCIKAPIYRNANGRPEVNRTEYEAAAILKPAESSTEAPAYISNPVKLTYTAIRTITLQ